MKFNEGQKVFIKGDGCEINSRFGIGNNIEMKNHQSLCGVVMHVDEYRVHVTTEKGTWMWHENALSNLQREQMLELENSL